MQPEDFESINNGVRIFKYACITDDHTVYHLNSGSSEKDLNTDTGYFNGKSLKDDKKKSHSVVECSADLILKYCNPSVISQTTMLRVGLRSVRRPNYTPRRGPDF